MKKILIFALTLIAAGSLFSCKKAKEIDATTWLDSLDDGKIVAQRENKKIVLFFSADDQDTLSAILKENLLQKEGFLAEATQKYVLVNLDFSNTLYEQTLVDEDASAAEKKAAQALQEKLDYNMKLATVYYAQMSPTFYLLNKDGYVLSFLYFDDTLDSFDAFEAEIASHEEEVNALEEALARTEKGTNLEKVQAIDDVYELTAPQLVYLLSPLAQQVEKLDSKNESGLVGKYVLALADAEATDAALDNDPQKMVAIFAKAAENKHVTADEKQQAYYYAGYFLAGTGSPDYEQIKEYVQKSYDAAPESERAPQIANLLQMIDERIASTNEPDDALAVDGETAADAAQDAQGANTFTIE